MKKLLLFLIILSFFNACQSAKDALTLKKKSSADEFLVEKKSPLVLPPVFGELPLPGEKLEKKKESKSEDIQITLGENEMIKKENTNNQQPSSIEESVLKKIK